ncbi:hypothetical protein evm_000532 [Chilo suppressalis]|nr:hypothetical protein evm_000532 [Chilo suppressalis]
MPTHHSRICSLHFKSEDIYTTQKGYKKISKNALPLHQTAMEANNYSFSRSDSFNSLSDVSISDMESIFETPIEVFQKRKSRGVTIKKQMLMEGKKSTNKRLYQKSKSLKETLIRLKKKINISEDQFRELSFKAETVDLLQRMKQCNKSKQNTSTKFPPSLGKFASTLYLYSPSGYKYMRKVFENSLPHPRIIGKWYEKRKAAPGFTAEAFEILKKNFQSIKTRLFCTLVVDEMAIRQQYIWNGRRTEGLVDYGTGSIENDSIASKAFVMMLVSMNENWKLPVAYFFVNTLTAECKANLIKICLEKCYEVGVDVVAITFDGCRSNFSAAKLLGCKLDSVNCLKTTFNHPSCDMDVAVFPDPGHMIKLVRNSFESKKVLFNAEGQQIKWQFLESDNEGQTRNPAT